MKEFCQKNAFKKKPRGAARAVNGSGIRDRIFLHAEGFVQLPPCDIVSDYRPALPFGA